VKFNGSVGVWIKGWRWLVTLLSYKDFFSVLFWFNYSITHIIFRRTLFNNRTISDKVNNVSLVWNCHVNTTTSVCYF